MISMAITDTTTAVVCARISKNRRRERSVLDVLEDLEALAPISFEQFLGHLDHLLAVFGGCCHTTTAFKSSSLR